MSTAVLDTPISLSPGAIERPSLARLVHVELRKTVNTRAGFWLQAAIVALTLIVVAVRAVVGDTPDHTFGSILKVGLFPAAILMPIVGILMVTSEWSQRTGMITFALVPVRSRLMGAKVLASIAVAVAVFITTVAIVAGGALAAGVGGTWTYLIPLVGQSAVYLVGGMIIGVAFGMVLLSSAPAIVALFALPIGWTALASLPVFAGVAPWLDTNRSLSPLSQEVISSTQWARVGTSLAVWMLLPLLIGAWRITKREAAS
jgi:ABC-2 type transport system permease protein